MLCNGPTRVNIGAGPAAVSAAITGPVGSHAPQRPYACGHRCWPGSRVQRERRAGWSSNRARCLRGTSAGPVAELTGGDACAPPVLARWRFWEAATLARHRCWPGGGSGRRRRAARSGVRAPRRASGSSRSSELLRDHPRCPRLLGPRTASAITSAQFARSSPTRGLPPRPTSPDPTEGSCNLPPASSHPVSPGTTHRPPRRAGTARRRRAGPVTSRRNPRFVRTFPAPATSGEEHEQRSLAHAERSNPQVSGWSKGMPQYACEKAGKCRIPWWARSRGPDGGVSGR